jgi:5-hydroxyisourate hydrolase-like protein (transthyretin family)
VPEDDFYDNVIFKGAFCSEGVWIQSWTALAQNGVLDASIPFAGEGCELSTSTDEVLTESNGYILKQSVPNPAGDMVTIDFTVPRTTSISLTVFSSDGRIVAQPINNDTFLSGQHRLEFNVSNLPNGIYFYNLRNAEVSITKAIVVDKR